MSDGAQVDYDALAKQYGATSSAAPQIDYDALARQHGATSSAAPPSAQKHYIMGPGGPVEYTPGADPLEASQTETTVGLIGGAGKSALQSFRTVQSLAQKLIPKSQRPEIPQEELHPTYQGAAEKIGAGAESTLEFIAGDEALKGLALGDRLYRAANLSQYLSQFPTVAKALDIGMNALRSGTVGGGQAIIHGATPTQAAKTAAVTAGTSGAIETATTALPALADWLRGSAEKNYKDVLNPTKQATKYQTQRIMPQLLEERPMAVTRAGLAEKAGEEAETLGQQIEQKVSGLSGSMNTQPVVDGLQKLKKSFEVGGVNLRPEAADAIDAVSDQIKAMGPTISYQDAVRARRILDQAVKEGGGWTGKSLSDASLTAIRKETANSIRSELAKASPDLAALNSKFHFWNTLNDVLEQTIQRKTGQAATGLLPTIETAAAGGAGLAHGGLAAGGGYAGVAWMLGKTVRSTAWRTASAAAKSSLADALASGDAEKALELLRQIGSSAAAQSSQ